MDNVEILKLVKEQLGIMYELLSMKIMVEGSRVVAEISMHRRDEHLKYWDPMFYLENKKKQDNEIDELYRKMIDNRQKIAKLIEPPLSTEQGFKGWSLNRNL